jgi:transposase
MNTLTKIERFFKETPFSADDQLFVGVDVHKKSYHVALYLNDAPSIDFVMPANKEQLSQTLKPTRPALRQVAYETGFSGYGLARCLTKDHLPVSVAATSKIPRPSAADDKTDKLDSKKLAEYAAKGLLKPVAIPTLKQEADRQLYRMRHRQSRNLAKVKVQIKSFLMMHDIEPPAGLSSWSQQAVTSLKTAHLRKTLRLSLDELLSDLDYYASRLKSLDKAMAEHLDKGTLARRMALLKTHPGVGTVVACQFATELFQYRDFNSTREVFKYLGLAPRIHQSGEHAIRGSINKLSNSRLRSNLNQAAWRWVAVDVNAKKTFLRILNNCGGIKQKAITAMTRKLAGHLWMMLIKDQPYDPTK